MTDYMDVERGHTAEAAQPEASGPWPARHMWWLVGAAVAGAAARLAAYAHGRSLWLDEAMLANNIVERSFVGLLQPLDGDQAAPVGFLWIVEALTRLLGINEHSLRLVPLVAGLAALALFLPMIVRITNRPGQIVGMLLFASSASLIWFSNEFKQYGLDALSTVVLLWLGLRMLAGHGGVRAWIVLGVVGIACIIMSHASLFVAAGAGMVLAAQALAQRRWRAVAVAAIVGVVWIGVFSLMFVTFYSHTAGDNSLMSYWDDAFAPIPPTSVDEGKWYFKMLHTTMEGAIGGREPMLGSLFTGLWVVLALIGVYAVGVRGRWELAMLLAPFVLALLASGLEKYPFAPRLLLFAAPIGIALVAAASGMLSAAVAARSRTAGWVVIAAITLFPVLHAANRTARPYEWEESRQLYDLLAAQMEPNDALYVPALSGPAFHFYERDGQFEERQVIRGRKFLFEPALLDADLQEMKSQRRVWVVLTHEAPLPDGRTNRAVLYHGMDRIAREHARLSVAGAEARLYVFEGADTTPSSSHTDDISP